MADIQAIRNAIDEHLALHVATLGAKADAEAVESAAREAIVQAKSGFDTANTQAQKSFNTSVETAKTKRDEAVAAEEEKISVANTAVTSAEEASEVYRAKVKEDLNIEMPDYSGTVSGGHTRL